MSSFTPSNREDLSSQLPALQLLQNLGFTYLSPSEALALRGGRKSNLLLEPILRAQLQSLNRIEWAGASHAWSESNLQNGVRILRDLAAGSAGLLVSNAEITTRLLLGASLPQSIDGDTRSHTLEYIDWNPATWATRNVFHVTEEFSVERTGSVETRRPDLVLFVNGIPLAVIECKSPQEGVEQAVSQNIRNQREDEIPALFAFTQLLMGIAQNDARYATTGTSAKFWSVWKEKALENDESGAEPAELSALVRRPLSPDAKDRMFAHRSQAARAQFEALETTRLISEQDRALFSLCRPERLLEIAHDYTLFDAGEKKVARYQQFFLVKNLLERIQKRDGSEAGCEAGSENERGGMVWHTQGSGKSLTMVMLAKALARLGLSDIKIVLVTDRVALDGQILGTFDSCDIEVVKAPSGEKLAGLLKGGRSQVVTTTIHKFTGAVAHGLKQQSPDIFVLVDEAHRSQFGEFYGRMKQALPRACYIGFTGTPLKSKEKNSIHKYGGLIQPVYTIRQAVEDGAVLSLLYEGRHVPQEADREQLDTWFERRTRTLTAEQRADLKRKHSGADQLGKAKQLIFAMAADVSDDFSTTWQGTGLKAQLVAPDKNTAIQFKAMLDDLGEVSSEVVISAPDTREGNEEVDESELPLVQGFWKKMMARFGNEKTYNDEIVAKFKGSGDPEILIVVDKLLTGFDAPRNTVLYLAKPLQGHSLLQAIARVNRLFEDEKNGQGKEFGFIVDYRGVLGQLSEAMSFYDRLAEYDAGDIEDTWFEVASEIEPLGERHSAVWELFNGVNRADPEAMQGHLGDQARRDDFGERLSRFARTFKLALSSGQWLEKTPDTLVETYRRDLKFWLELRGIVAQRYAEAVNFKAYEAQIQKLVDEHVKASPAVVVVEEIDIFDRDAFRAAVEGVGGESAASKADQIAHRLKKSITLKIEDDPAFYQKFSEMVEDTIRAFAEKRISEQEYLAKITALGEDVSDRSTSTLPAALHNEPIAQAFYGLQREALEPFLTPDKLSDVAARFALETDHVIRAQITVGWQGDSDARKQLEGQLDDLWHDLAGQQGFGLPLETLDALLERIVDLARRRYAR